MSELELKFQVPPRALEALRADLLAGQAGPDIAVVQPLQAVYFDTADRLLGRHLMALRLRREGDRWVQTLKAAKPHSMDRLEENADAGPASAAREAVPPALDLARHPVGEDTAGALLRALLAAHPGAVLAPRYTTDVRRLRRVAEVGDATIEVALDEGTLRAGELSAPVCEIEFELLAGSSAGLFRLAAHWQRRHGLWLDVASKAHRGDCLADGVAAGPAVRATPPRLARGATRLEACRAILAACLAQVMPNLSALAHGADDDEAVHQARVGLRRLRTALEDAVGGAAWRDAAWDAPLHAAFEILGADRDAHVLPGLFAKGLAAAGAPLVDWPEDGAARRAATRDAVVDPSLHAALLGVLAVAEAGPSAPDATDDEPAHRSLSRRLQQLHREATRRARRFADLPEPERHARRRHLKRLRYLAEFAAPLFPSSRVRRYARHLAPAQDASGLHVDEMVARERFRAVAATDPRAWFAVGWLQARHGASARDARRALERLGDAKPFWDDDGA